jgi:hypothetical protein
MTYKLRAHGWDRRFNEGCRCDKWDGPLSPAQRAHLSRILDIIDEQIKRGTYEHLRQPAIAAAVNMRLTDLEKDIAKTRESLTELEAEASKLRAIRI